MCGRYTLIRHNHLVEIIPNFTIPANLRLVARYNIAPTQEVPIVLPSGEMTLARWGLVPHWAKDKSIGVQMINARSETLAQRPAFKNLLPRNRCLVPADGFYEWQKNPSKTGHKIPHYIRLKSQSPFFFAGLFDRWQDKSQPPSPSLESRSSLLTFTITTVPANALVAPLHDRMPAILLPAPAAAWLAEPDVEKALTLLQPCNPDLLELFPVNPRVNSVKNDSPEILTPAQTTGLLF